MRVGRVGGDLVKIGGDGPDVFCDGPLVVVEDDDEFLGGFGDVVQRLVADPAGKGGVARDADDAFIRAAAVAPHGHAERGAEGGAGVARAVAVVLAFRAQEEAIEALILAHRAEALAASGEKFVDVALVGDIEDEFVLGRVEDAVQRDG